MKYIFICIFIFLGSIATLAQREVVMSQYMYNKYVINPAFGGSHDVLSMYGSYQKQWLGIDNSPSSAFFSLHTPLKKEQLAVGMQLFSERIAVSKSTGLNFSYSYRMKIKNEGFFSLGIAAGILNYQSNWSSVILSDQIPDDAFMRSEHSVAPWLGFGAGLYKSNYFVGFSIPSLIYYDRYQTAQSKLDFSTMDYLFTGGYLFKVSDLFFVQPSTLLRVNFSDGTFVDMSATAIIAHSILGGISYRTTNELITILGYQISPQFRFTYSFNYDIDPIGTYTSGTHEIAIQYDFGYTINTPNPKFF
jgi:type IX secretion system PorP/SprF family membrane protein